MRNLRYVRSLCPECCNPSCPGCLGDEPEATAIAAQPVIQCRFYGMNGMHGRLVATRGNQCGLVTNSHAPCAMEIMGDTPNENTCPLVAKVAARVRPEVKPGA
jgi:hypothetical protein